MAIDRQQRHHLSDVGNSMIRLPVPFSLVAPVPIGCEPCRGHRPASRRFEPCRGGGGSELSDESRMAVATGGRSVPDPGGYPRRWITPHAHPVGPHTALTGTLRTLDQGHPNAGGTRRPGVHLAPDRTQPRPTVPDVPGSLEQPLTTFRPAGRRAPDLLQTRHTRPSEAVIQKSSFIRFCRL